MKVTGFPFADYPAKKELLSAETARFAFAHRHADPEKTPVLLLAASFLLF